MVKEVLDSLRQGRQDGIIGQCIEPCQQQCTNHNRNQDFQSGIYEALSLFSSKNAHQFLSHASALCIGSYSQSVHSAIDFSHSVHSSDF